MRVKVVTVMRYYAQDGVNQEDSEQNEVDGMKGADSTGKVMHISEVHWLDNAVRFNPLKPTVAIWVQL